MSAHEPPPRTVATRRPGRLLAWCLRLPARLQRIRVLRLPLGELVLWVKGTPHIRVTHVGRRSGAAHHVMLEVLETDPATGEVRVAAMWGPGSDWYRNLERRDSPEVETRGRRFVPRQRILPADEAQAVLDRYRRHRLRALLVRRMIGRPLDAASMPVIGFTDPAGARPTDAW